MKVSPLAQGTGSPAGSNMGDGRSAGSDRIARAKAVANGQQPQENLVDHQAQRAQNDIRRIKMVTNRTVNRYLPEEEEDEVANSNIGDAVDTESQVNAETKPIDPQLALKAQYSRIAQKIAQEKDAKIAELESKLKAMNPGDNADYIPVSKLTENPLSVLREKGVSYDRLTEDLLQDQSYQTPAVLELKAEIKALKEAMETQKTTQAQQDEASKQQVLSQMERDALKMVAQGDQYELVRETGSIKDVIRLIDTAWKDQGEILDVEEALQLVEDQLLEDNLKFARTKKVMSKLTPAQEQTQKPQNNPNVRVMRTLTSRDGAQAPSSRRERAMKAFYGQK